MSKEKKTYKSIKWRVIIGYMLILFFALTGSGIIIINKIETYQSKIGLIGVLNLKEDVVSILIETGLVALLLTFIVGLYFFKKLINPIEGIAQSAEDLIKGENADAVKISSNTEIGRLADSFNELKEQYNENLSEISNEKNKLEAILEHMTDGVIAVDSNGKIIHINSSAMKLLHIDKNDVFLKNYDEIVNEFKGNLSYQRLIDNENELKGRVILKHLDSFFLVNYRPYNDAQGNNSGIVMVIQDITERQKIENMQKDFLANVSHELKTPITTIKSYTETLLSGALLDIETATKFLKIVDSETERMTNLVSDLLRLSSLEYNAQKLVLKKIELVNVVKEAVKNIEINSIAKEQHISLIFTKGLKVFVLGDYELLNQAVLNILSNAIKYTQQGGHIDINIEIKEEIVNVIISDNGIGITKKEMGRLFERFYRVDKARTRSHGGTGLGLFIVKEIMNQHNGEVNIESTEGKGSKVTLTLPLWEKKDGKETEKKI